MLYMLIRWTIPRFRFDQLMGLAWKVLIPLALVNLLAVMVVKQFGDELLAGSLPMVVCCRLLVVAVAAARSRRYSRRSGAACGVRHTPAAPRGGL